jgi:hypothetical protein
MNNLYLQESVNLIKNRINQLENKAEPLWGEMNVAQMLSHCKYALDMASCEINPPRILLGRVLGPLVKQFYYNERPFSKNAPTDPMVKVANQREFDTEKKELIVKLDYFHKAGEEQCTSYPHPFFGKFTPQQWSIGMYKHLDHHLRQFGV